MLTDFVKYTRLAYALKGFVQSPISYEQSRQAISARLRNRETNLLSLVQKGIFQYEGSPYLPLLKHAGCEYGDIEQGIKNDGIENTLKKLMQNGVYISWEEFKGKQEVIRGGKHFPFKERDFDNPYLSNYYQVTSSGSRSAGTRTTLDLKFTEERSYYRLPLLRAYNAEVLPAGFWLPMLPSAAGVLGALQTVKTRQEFLKWFSPVTERQVKGLLRDRIAMRYIIYASRLWGAKIPWPEYVGLEQAVTVAAWMAETKKRYGGCLLRTNTSLGVMVCQAAIENKLDISGCHFQLGGEAMTEARQKWITNAGATSVITYHVSEVGWIGCGCSQATAVDDMHLFHDSTALIQRHRTVEPSGIEVDTFVFSSLLPTSPKILLNVENDDYGDVETRECGCVFNELGFHHHLSNVRSFSRLTGRGMTIAAADFIRIMEEVLPVKFGGAPTDYQLQEDEDAQGEAHLNLIINPSVGDVDEKAVIDTVLDELQKKACGGKLASGLWSQAPPPPPPPVLCV